MIGGKRLHMGKRARSRSNFKFSDRIHPITGIISVALAVLSSVMIIGLFVSSSQSDGKGGILLGLAGLLALIISSVGMFFSVIALKKEDIHYRFPVLGAILNGLLIIIYLILYIYGALIM